MTPEQLRELEDGLRRVLHATWRLPSATWVMLRHDPDLDGVMLGLCARQRYAGDGPFMAVRRLYGHEESKAPDFGGAVLRDFAALRLELIRGMGG